MHEEKWLDWEPAKLEGLERQLPAPEESTIRNHTRFRLVGSPAVLEARTDINYDGDAVVAVVRLEGNNAPHDDLLKLITKALTYYNEVGSWSLEELKKRYGGEKYGT